MKLLCKRKMMMKELCEVSGPEEAGRYIYAHREATDRVYLARQTATGLWEWATCTPLSQHLDIINGDCLSMLLSRTLAAGLEVVELESMAELAAWLLPGYGDCSQCEE